MKKIIYWFSASGNSFYAARTISSLIESEGDTSLVKITKAAADPEPLIECDVAGFVFPVYALNVPSIVKEFINRAHFKGTPYIFSIVTQWIWSGDVSRILSRIFKKKAQILSYCNYVTMPGNSLFLCDPSEISSDKTLKNLEKVREKLKDISIDIKGRDRFLAGSRLAALPSVLIGKGFSFMLKNADKKFEVSGNCTGCGICASLCPSENIEIVKGRPEFKGRCLLCMGCSTWCPEKALGYGHSAVKRSRYHNPEVRPEDLFGP